jgi:hypothetical protein
MIQRRGGQRMIGGLSPTVFQYGNRSLAIWPSAHTFIQFKIWNLKTSSRLVMDFGVAVVSRRILSWQYAMMCHTHIQTFDIESQIFS